METQNLLLFMSIVLLRQLLILNICLIISFQTFCTELILGLMKDLFELMKDLINESVRREYVNIFIFSQLSGNRYIELSCGLRNAMKNLININNGNKFSLWCHIRPLNPLKTDPEKITKAVKIMVNNLDYEGVDFLFSKKDFGKF